MRRKIDACLAVVGLVLLMAGGMAGCKVQYPKCAQDKDCHEHEYCVNQQCQQCRSTKDCNGGACNQGRCDPPRSSMSLSCTDDTQCPAGESCISGACKACQSDNECGDGGKCHQGRCARAPGDSGSSSIGGCNLDPIYFDFNENVLSTEATSAIDHDAECLKKSPGAITLTGHTDPRGTEEYNLALSDRRTQSVRDRLQKLGAPATSVKLVPKGELEAAGADESGWAKDRRVDFTR